MITVNEFHQKYGVLPNPKDPRWKREQQLSYVHSRIQVVDRPILSPGMCCLCKADSIDRKYIDLGVDFEQGPPQPVNKENSGHSYVQVVYICTKCIIELFGVVTEAGILPKPEPKMAQPEPQKQMSQEPEDKLDDIINRLNELSNLVLNAQSSDSNLDDSETSPEGEPNSTVTAEDAEGASGSDSSRRSANIQSLEELLGRGKSNLFK